ncbi:hypothetical protein G5B41_07465 [bacterium SGD-2]|nr:hypothetical protein [bacterium SGD-2]
MFFSRTFRASRTLALSAVAILAACSTTGNRFDTADLRFLVPGETTLAEATQLLQGEPVNVYRQLDGSATARWAHTATLATDAVYFNQELWLAFDSAGRFVRIVKSNNVPHANLYEDGRRVDLPVPQGSIPAAAPMHSPGPSVQAGMPATPASSPATSPFSRTTASYPLAQ